MDNYENQFAPKKKSPFADSPYECAYIEHEPIEPEVLPSAPKKRRGMRPLFVAALLVLCCGATAFAVTRVWQGRVDRMELAMEEKFAALQQLFSEKQNQNPGTPLPEQVTEAPGQVYANNVNAVVAVNAVYQTANGYGESAGSGFVLSADGYVVTNYHVIEGSEQVSVTLHNGDTLEAQVVGFESTNDVALLKVEAANLPCVKLGSSDALTVGDMVVAIGNPLGELTSTLTVGYISAKDRIVDTDGTVINMLQTDAAINSGNSGGPLFNLSGEVVGITTAKYSGNSSSGASIEGLGFAIPMDDVTGILSDLKEFGYVTGAYLGVMVRDVDANAQSYGLPAGAYVTEVTKGSAAEKAGIRPGDILVNLGGYDVDSLTTLTRVLRRFDAGQTASVTVYRNGQQQYLTITFDQKPVEQTQPAPETNQNPNQNGGFYWPDFFDKFFG